MVRTPVMLVLLVLPSLARAELCRPTPAESDAQGSARLAEITAIFAKREPEMRLWFGSFAAFHTVSAGATVAFALETDDPNTRDAQWIGAASSGLGLVSMLIAYPPLLGAGQALDALPAHSPEAVKRKLHFAEARLERSAKAARQARSIWSRLLSGAYSLSTSAVVWLVLDRPLGAVQQLAGGVLIGQGRISLYPIGIAEDWERYRQQYGSCRAVSTSRGPDWTLTPSRGGLGLQIRF